MTIPIDDTTLDYFYDRIIPIPFSGCWIWSGEITPAGYGRAVRRKGERERVHRLSWRLFHGDPGDLCVLHKCDVTSCCNPDHLFLGTQAENQHDKARKGRASKRDGERHHLHKLTEDKIAVAVSMRKSGYTVKEIKDYLGISAGTLYDLFGGVSWGGRGLCKVGQISHWDLTKPLNERRHAKARRSGKA